MVSAIAADRDNRNQIPELPVGSCWKASESAPSRLPREHSYWRSLKRLERKQLIMKGPQEKEKMRKGRPGKNRRDSAFPGTADEYRNDSK